MLHSTIDNHWVLITDEIGMASVFPKLKGKLAEARLTAITILYHSTTSHFAFRRELSMLEWYFPGRLYVFYESPTQDESYMLNQEAVEAVINANTVPVMSFMISGGPEFTAHAKSILAFLGIHNIDIQEQFFTCL